jgi:tetratricopeptide (TPR) repeat protein
VYDTPSITPVAHRPGGVASVDASSVDTAEIGFATGSGVWEIDLVLAALDGDDFTRRRASVAVGEIADPTERALVGRVLEVDPASDEEVATTLLSLCGFLETRGRYAAAVAVVETARRRLPRNPALALHAARAHRRAGDRAVAADLYAEVRALDPSRGDLYRMARIGEALIADEPTRALGRPMREAREAGDAEAAALAQCERARLRRRTGDRDGAARDYIGAAVRFPDRVDGGRAGHECADMLIAAGQSDAARTVLMATLEIGHAVQAEWARARLHALSRTMGDEVGRRRWAGSAHPELASLTLRGPRARQLPSRPLERFLRRITAACDAVSKR